MMKTIVLDAGHGGKDIGATFKDLNEADITLITAFYLEHQLKRAGYKVVMTRDIDEYIALDRRTYIANSNKADIFISIHCFTGDTKISLLDGTEIPIKDLVNRDEFYVYSYDKESNKIVSGRAHSVRKTGEKRKILKITLDNDEAIRCTENHRFLLRTGKYVEAIKLREDDRLMPLVTELSEAGYEVILHPNGEKEKTYRVSDRYNLNRELYLEGNGYAIHHKDFNLCNNSPDNLIRLHQKEHFQRHAEYNKSPERRKAIGIWSSKHNAERVKNGTHNFLGKKFGKWQSVQKKKLIKSGWKPWSYGLTKETDERVKRTSEYMKINNPGNLPYAKERQLIAMKEMFSKGVHPFQVNKKELLLKRSKGYVSNILATLSEEGLVVNKDNYNIVKSRFPNYYPRYDTAVKLGLINHKIISIESDGYEDVYDITVDKYHNFALTAGVFVHNCNADPDDDTNKNLEAKGEEIWVYKDSEKGRELAEFLAVTVDCIFSSTKFRGIKETDRLYVLKHTKMPAVLLELGFLDNLKENNYFSKLSSYKDISNLIFKGIENYFKG